MAYRVLLMDDEPAICEISGILLKKLGYEPVIAVSGEEALTQYKNARDSGKPLRVLHNSEPPFNYYAKVNQKYFTLDVQHILNV